MPFKPINSTQTVERGPAVAGGASADKKDNIVPLGDMWAFNISADSWGRVIPEGEQCVQYITKAAV